MPDTRSTPETALSAESMAAMIWSLREFRSQRQGQYFQYYKYIDGDMPLKFATEKFESAFGSSFDSFAYNRAESVVDAITDRLHLAGWGGDDQKTPQLAKDIWDGNDMAERESHVYDEAATAGDAYVIVEKHPRAGEIQIWPQTAINCRVRYSPDRPGEINLGARQWVEPDGYARINLYFKDRIEKYRSKAAVPDSTDIYDFSREVSAAELAGSFVPFQPDDDTAWPIRLTGETVPVFHFANNGRVNAFGRSELAPLIPIQDALNKTLMDLLVAMEFAAFPQRYLINADTAGSEEAMRRYQAGIERLINIRQDLDGQPVGAGEFSAADVQQYIDPIDLFDRLISRVSKVPEHYLRLLADFPSGRALRLAEAPFVAKLEKRHRAFGGVWLRVMIYSLALKGTVATRQTLRPSWQSAAPLGREDLLDVAHSEKALGLALKTILRETLGLDADQITTYLDEITEEQDERAARFNAGLGPGLGLTLFPPAGQPKAAPGTPTKPVTDENAAERRADKAADKPRLTTPERRTA